MFLEKNKNKQAFYYIASMFKGCKSLKSIYMTNCNEDTVEKIKDAAKKAGLSETIVKTSH